MNAIEYPLCEIFASIEGEGIRAGYPATFIRLAGCNLRCSYCDTEYALSTTQATERLTAEQIIARVKAYPWKLITLTGGEPLLHHGEELTKLLASHDYEVNIETNGAVPLFKERVQNSFYTMDWKTSSSGESAKMLEENLALLTERDALKFVVGTKSDLAEMRELINKFFPCERNCNPVLFVSPVWGKIDAKEIVDFLKENKLQQVRLQLQLHKFIWHPEERGV